MSIEEKMARLAHRITAVPGVRGVVLGGSRARHANRPDSDWDFGIYYSGALDITALQLLADDAADEPAELSPCGGWGPWVNGGGWLTIEGAAVDWIYRDLDRVDEIGRRALQGKYEFCRQPGHPLGFLDVSYVGELMLGQIMADPAGELAARRATYATYPPELGKAFVAGLWEADFDLSAAAKSAPRGDAVYVAGTLFHALSIAAHALHGQAGRWVTNEKGIIAAAATLPNAPQDLAARAQACLAFGSAGPSELVNATNAARQLIAEIHTAVGAPEVIDLTA